MENHINFRILSWLGEHIEKGSEKIIDKHNYFCTVENDRGHYINIIVPDFLDSDIHNQAMLYNLASKKYNCTLSFLKEENIWQFLVDTGEVVYTSSGPKMCNAITKTVEKIINQEDNIIDK